VTCVHIYIYTQKKKHHLKGRQLTIANQQMVWSLEKRRDYSAGVDIAPAGRVVMVVVWCLENKEGGGGGLKRLESTKITSLLDVHFCIYYEKPL